MLSIGYMKFLYQKSELRKNLSPPKKGLTRHNEGSIMPINSVRYESEAFRMVRRHVFMPGIHTSAMAQRRFASSEFCCCTRPGRGLLRMP